MTRRRRVGMILSFVGGLLLLYAIVLIHENRVLPGLILLGISALCCPASFVMTVLMPGSQRATPSSDPLTEEFVNGKIDLQTFNERMIQQVTGSESAPFGDGDEVMVLSPLTIDLYRQRLPSVIAGTAWEDLSYGPHYVYLRPDRTEIIVRVCYLQDGSQHDIVEPVRCGVNDFDEVLETARVKARDHNAQALERYRQWQETEKAVLLALTPMNGLGLPGDGQRVMSARRRNIEE